MCDGNLHPHVECSWRSRRRGPDRVPCWLVLAVLLVETATGRPTRRAAPQAASRSTDAQRALSRRYDEMVDEMKKVAQQVGLLPPGHGDRGPYGGMQLGSHPGSPHGLFSSGPRKPTARMPRPSVQVSEQELSVEERNLLRCVPTSRRRAPGGGRAERVHPPGRCPGLAILALPREESSAFRPRDPTARRRGME